MRAKRVLFGLAAVTVCASVFGVVWAADDAETKPKHTIKEVMKTAHKDGLLKKIMSGDASQEDKLVLLDNYISLVESEPPKGDMESWQILSGKAALAAAKMAVGREGAAAELKAATNCAACHKVHKGE